VYRRRKEESEKGQQIVKGMEGTDGWMDGRRNGRSEKGTEREREKDVDFFVFCFDCLCFVLIVCVK
jgi:hypothetical protein